MDARQVRAKAQAHATVKLGHVRGFIVVRSPSDNEPSVAFAGSLIKRLWMISNVSAILS